MLAFLHKMRFGKSIKCTTLGVFIKKKLLETRKICVQYTVVSTMYNTYITSVY